MTKRIFMIAGPNGAGKTTTALSLFPEPLAIDEFINADEIARGLAPLNPESTAIAASKLMILRFRELLRPGKSFAFETTAASTNYLKYLIDAQVKGYEFHLIYLWLASPEQAIKRVATRVAQGGHHVPTETIRRRYYLGIKNLFKYYLSLADNVILIDNSSEISKETIARKDSGELLQIKNITTWKKIQKLAHGQAKKN